MISLSFSEISDRLHNTQFPDVDIIVGIGTGGVVVSSLIAHQLSRPLYILKVSFRDDDNKIKYDSPVLLSEISAINADKILLVDDVSVSGATLHFVKKLLDGYNVTTIVLKGNNADIVLFPEIKDCVKWPWKV